MVKQKLISRIRAGLALGALLALASCVPARSAGSAAPGKAVGHVFLGMERADVWKILGKPSHTAVVPHGMNLYGEDTWANNGRTLAVLSEHDEVIQVEFDSPRITTTDGLTTRSTLAQVRRRHPSMTVQVYRLVGYGDDVETGTDGYYLDDVRRGVAFAVVTPMDMAPRSLNSTPARIIIHRLGVRAVPIYHGHWSGPEPLEDPVAVSLVRSWFTPDDFRRGLY